MVNSESMDSSGDGKPKDYITQLNSGGGGAGISIDTHSPSPVTASSVRLRDMDFDANESAADITSADCANPIDSLPETAVTRSIHEENFRLTSDSTTVVITSQQTESETSSLYCSVPLNKVQDVLSSYSVDSPSAGDDCGDAKNKKLIPRRLLCLYCDRTFVTSNLRQKHVDRCHSVKQARRSSSRFQTRFTTACIFCKKLNNTDHSLNDLFKHLVERHSNKYFACVACEERFSFKAHLEEHNQQNHEQKVKPRVQDEVPKFSCAPVSVESNNVEDETNTLKTKHKTKIKRDAENPENHDSVVNRPNLRMSVRKELRKKKVGVKSTKTGVKRNTRLQTKVTNAQTKTPAKKRMKTRHDKSLELPEKPSSSVNPYPTFDAFFRVKKITDHSIDNLKISSLTFDDVFDKAFYNRIKCNIQENLQNHIDGKLFKNEESESRISNFEKNQELNSSPAENFGCDISLNAATPVVSLLSSQLGEDFESQIEYGAKASKKKPPPKKDEVHYKYFTRRKYQASILESKENRDLSKLDMWTQLVVKDRQQKIINDKKTEKEKIEYTKGIEYRTKMQNLELNRILDRRGPFEDLKEEANKKAALEKYNRLGESVSCEAISDVACILDDLVDRVFECSENPVKMEENETILDQEKPPLTDEDCEIPFYLNLRRNSSLLDQPDIDRSDRITLICSSQETENFEETATPRDKNSLVELTGEWTRTRIYICAACGVKVPNMKHLVDHKSVYHQNVWVQHYEFVGNQSVLYKHLSIPCMGKVGHFEEFPIPKSWKRSDSRLCTKCSRMCNTLGELHRHMLECGEDWSWMLARKKLKYRPFGAKSRRKRRGLVKRIIHKEKSGDEVREKKKYNIKRYDGPRPKPSDAETIQRMLANLPAKRATRKLISLKDGFPKQIRRKPAQKSKNNPINTSTKNIPSTKRQTSTASLKQQTLKGRGRQKKGLKCNPMILRKSMRNINKIFSSKILDSNSTLLVKRKIKTVLQHQRITRARKMQLEEEPVGDKSTQNPTCPKKKEGLIGKVKMLTKAVKRTVLKKDEKKIENNGGVSSVNVNNANTSVVNKTLTRTTRNLKKSDSLDDTIKDIISSIDASDTNSDSSKETTNKKKIDEKQPAKSEDETSAKAEISKKKPKLMKKESVGTKLVRTLSLRKLRKKNTEEEKLKTQSNPELDAKNIEGKVKNGKRKSSLDSFKNKIKRIKLKDKNAPQIAQVDGSSQISDEILPFLEKIHIGSDENQERNDAAKNTENIEDVALIDEAKTIEASPVEQPNIDKEELIDSELKDLRNENDAKHQPKPIQAEELINNDEINQIAENILNNASDAGTEITAQEAENSCNNSDQLVMEETTEKPEEVVNVNASTSVLQGNAELDNTHIPSNVSDTKTCTSSSKTKSKKRSKGLNACIAMLTSKLQQKVDDTQVGTDVMEEAPDKFDVADSASTTSKEILSENVETKGIDKQEVKPAKECKEYATSNSNNVITDHLVGPKLFETNHKIIENLEMNRQELLNLQSRFIAEQQQLLLQHIYRQLPNYQYNYIPALPREANFLINNIMFNGQNQIGDKFLQLNQNPDNNMAKLLGNIDRNHKFKEVDVNIEFDIMKYLGNVADNCVVKMEKLKNKNNDAKKKPNNKAGGTRRCNNKRKENINVVANESKEQDTLNKMLNEKSIETDESKHKKCEIFKENDKVIDLKVKEKPEDLTQCHVSKASLDNQNNRFVSSNQSGETTGVKAISNSEITSNGGEVIDLKVKKNIAMGKEATLFEQLTRNGISIALFPCPQMNQKKCEISTDKTEAIDLKIDKTTERAVDNFKLSTEQTKMAKLISLPNKFNQLGDTTATAAINLKINQNLDRSEKDLRTSQEEKHAMDVNVPIFNNTGLFAEKTMLDRNKIYQKSSEYTFGEKITTPFSITKPAKSFQSVFEESYKLFNAKPPKKAEKKKKMSKSSKQKLMESNPINSFSKNSEKPGLLKNEGNQGIIDLKLDNIQTGQSTSIIKPSNDLNIFSDQEFLQMPQNNNEAMNLKINKNIENKKGMSASIGSRNDNILHPLVPQSISKDDAAPPKTDIKNSLKEKKKIILKPPQFIATSLEKRPIIENPLIATFQTKPECLDVALPENAAIQQHHTNGITKSVKKKNMGKNKNLDNIECKIKCLFLEEREPDVMEEKALEKISSSRSNSKDRQSKDSEILQETKAKETCQDVLRNTIPVLSKSDTDSDDDIPLANLLKENQKKPETRTEAPVDEVSAETPANIEEPPPVIDNTNAVCNSSVLGVENDKLDTNAEQPTEAEVSSENQLNLISSVTAEVEAEIASEGVACEGEEAKTNNKKPRIRKRTCPADKKEKPKKKPPVKTPKSKGTPLYDETDAEFQNKAARKIKISCQIFQKSSKIVLDKSIFNEAENEDEEEDAQLPESAKSSEVPPMAELILPDIIIKEELSTEPVPQPPAAMTTEIVSRIKEELPEVDENDPEPEPIQSEELFSAIPEPSSSLTIEDLELEIRRRIKLSNLQLKRENIEDNQAVPAPINTDIIYEVDSPSAQVYGEETNDIGLDSMYNDNVNNPVEDSLLDMSNEILPTCITTMDALDTVAMFGDPAALHTDENVNLFENIQFEQEPSIYPTKSVNIDDENESRVSVDNIQNSIISNTEDNIHNNAHDNLIPENIESTTEVSNNEPVALMSDIATDSETNFIGYQKELTNKTDDIKENATVMTSLTDVEVTHDEENNTEMNFDVGREKEGDLPTENANTAPNLMVLEEYKQPLIRESENKSKKNKKKHEEVITDVIPAYGEFQVNSDQTSGINKITISRKKLQVNHNSSECVTENDIYVVKKIKKTHRKSTNNKEKKRRKSSVLLKENNIENNPSDNMDKGMLDKSHDTLENAAITFDNENLENVEFEVQNEEIGRKLKINKKKVKEIPPATNLEPSPPVVESNPIEDVEQTDVVDGAKDYDDLPKDMEIEEFQVSLPIIETNFNQTKFDVPISSDMIIDHRALTESFVSTQDLHANVVNKIYSNKHLIHDGFQIANQNSPMSSILAYRASGLNDKIEEQAYKENFESISRSFTEDLTILSEKTLVASNSLMKNSVYNDRYSDNSNSKSLNEPYEPYSMNSLNSLEDLSVNSIYYPFNKTQNDGDFTTTHLTISSAAIKKGKKSKNAKDKVHTLQTPDETKPLTPENYEDSDKNNLGVESESELQLVDAFGYQNDKRASGEKVQPQENTTADENELVVSIPENISGCDDVDIDEVDSVNHKTSKKSSNKKNKNAKNVPLDASLTSSDPKSEELKVLPKTDSVEVEQNKKSKKFKTSSKSTQENESFSTFDMMCDELQALCDAPLELSPLNTKMIAEEKAITTNGDLDVSNAKDFSTSSSSFCDNIKSSCDAKINELLREIDSSPRLGKKSKKSKNAPAKPEDCNIANVTMKSYSGSGDCHIEEDKINKLNDDNELERLTEEIHANISASTVMITPSNITEQLENFFETPDENVEKVISNTPSSKPKGARATKGSKKKSSKAKKERSFSIENTEELYCDICDKMFARSENLVKHKRTLTHIAKLSEIEAKEAQAKAKDIKETATSEVEDQSYKMDININDILNNSDKLSEQQQDLNNEIANKIHVNSPFVLKTNSDTLKLADIINDVLNKPVENEKHTPYSDSHLSQTSVTKNETKRYKSLGERKSFESDLKTTYPFNTMTVANDSIPKLSNPDTILKHQISILENIIETEGPFGYIDDITVSSSKSVEEPVTKSPSELSIMSKNDDSNHLTFTHNSNSIINTLIKPNINIHNQTFIKPTQYEEISNDSSSVRNQFDDQRSRKVLNRDEELFLECCSLLKSSSEVSGYSKRSSRTVHVLNNFEMKQTDEEPEWLERKTFAPKNQEYKHDVFPNSCPNTPLGDGYGDDCSNTNSNTIITDWSTKQKEHLQENPAFEDISLDSKGSTNSKQEINQFKGVERTFGDFQLFNTEREKDIEVNEECSNAVVLTEAVEDNINEKEADEDFKKKMVSRFGGLMAKAWRNSVQVVKKNKTKKKPSTEVTQTSITDYAVPLASNIKADNDLNDSKKMLTKGAMKVFEGLKVSIPTDDLDMKELLNTSHVAKKQEDVLNTQTEEITPSESEPLKEDIKAPKNNMKSFGNRLGLKVTKKKQSITKPKDSSTTTTKGAKNEDDLKKSHDVYDFEETQDNTDIFSSKLTNIKDFRNQIAEKKTLTECNTNKEATPAEDAEESDSDSRQGYIDSFNYEGQSLSSFSTESISSLKKPKKKNMTKKKCMIMGRIFKNAFKSKMEEDIRDIPSVDNAKLVEDYVMQLPPKEEKRPKLTEQEMDMLFDKLLEDKTPVEENTKTVENPTAASDKPMEKPAQPKQKPKNPPKRKRQRHNSDSTDDEFSLGKTKKRYNKKKQKNIDDSINLEQELKECIGVASRKSQRKCTSGKQNVLVEFWSSDDSNFEAFIRETAMDKPKNIRTESKLTDTGDNVKTDAKAIVETSVEEAFKDLADTIKKATPKIETDNQKISATQSVDSTTNKADKLANAKQARRKSSNCNKPRVKNDENVEDKKMKNIKINAETLAANRRKRAASNTLYYWSSSSEDESQDLIEIKPVRDEMDEDEDRPMQHGWIVGDSPKKLVTMLAQAKGKKMDADSVKEQGKKRTTM